MRAVLRLATSSLSERRSRTFLLIAVVSLAATLVSAVGVAMGSLRNAVKLRVDAMVGAADVRIKAKNAGLLPQGVLEQARGWEGVAAAVPRLDTSLSLRFGKPVWARAQGVSDGPFRRSVETFQSPVLAAGISIEPGLPSPEVELVSGRLPTLANEIVLDRYAVKRLSKKPDRPDPASSFSMAMFRTTGTTINKADAGPESVATQELADELNASSEPRVGDTVQVLRFKQEPVTLTIVGLAAQPPLGGRARVYMLVPALAALAGSPGQLSQVDLVLKPGTDAKVFVAEQGPKMPGSMTVQTAEKITSGLDKNLQANQLAFLLGTLMACIAAGFIITTGMSTGVVERQRELAILRCIGATPWQLAASQLTQGVCIGLAGAAVGVPLGAALAAGMVTYFQERLQAPLHFDVYRVLASVGGSLVAGLVGSAWPAWRATRVSPLAALAVRAEAPRARTALVLAAVGLACAAVHFAIFTLMKDRDRVFLTYVLLGLPSLMLGYFLLGVPAVLVAGRLLGPGIERLFHLPPHLLQRSVRATPYRFGFTAGALMGGLALMVAIWTQGGAALRDWVGRLQFPDAFAVGLNMPPEAQAELRSLDFVTDVCPISIYPVTTDAFGLDTFTKVKSSFVAFEPDAFFRMTRVDWVQGDEASARERLNEGGAVIVSREFLTARGQGVGDRFVCWDEDESRHEFEIVGVVTSPGLEVANDVFDVGEDFTQQRVHAVFGSRKDLVGQFHTETIGMLQFSMKAGIDDEHAMLAVKQALMPYGVLHAGSGRQLKQTMQGFVKTTLLVASCVAVFSMVVASFSVANVIIAGVQSRMFEFGVIRAVGGSGGAWGVLSRLVVGEVLIVVCAACVLGTLMGLQGAFGGLVLNRLIWGLELSLRPPLGWIGVGWLSLLVISVGAAAPAVASLASKQPRELLGAVPG